MKTKLGFSSDRGPRRCKLSSAVMAAMLGAGLLGAQPGSAQVVVESGVLAKGNTVAVTQMGRRPTTLSIAAASAPAGAPRPAAVPQPPVAEGPLRGPNCIGEIRGETTVVVPLGKSTLVPTDEPVRNRTLGNPAIAQATMVSPQRLYILGQSVGTTNMIIQGRSGACQIIDVVVNVDAGGLQASLSQLMPNERNLRVSTAADNFVLMGRVSSAQAAQEALDIAKAYSQSGGTDNASKSSGVLNMMTLDSPQQVMLEVKVAEVSKTLIDQLGSSLALQGGFGSWTGSLVSTLLSGASTILTGTKSNHLPISMSIDAQKTDNLTKILAEPNLVTITGQEASFLAGGKVFIPVPQSNANGGTTITLQEEEFGVGLRFTPTVLGNGRINLKVAPEVSELSPTGVTVTATGTSSTSILPLITTRRASTTVQMNDGESFAIGGLISNNVTGALKAFPGLGELPVIGALLRSTSFQQDRTELVFVVTPHLVKPLPNQNYPLPTDSFTQPNEADVYATGDMEGRGASRAKGAAPAGGAPSNSSTQPSAPADSQAGVPSPAPVPRAPTAPADAQLAPHDPPPAGPAPASPSSRDAAKQQTSAAQPPASQSAPAPDAQAARVARIEAAAARIAETEKRRAIAISSASNGTIKQ
ncbi:type II and III secretion system protein family protein [Trinickia mobilis]|uniref:type II and III secretion system protein family protein n=1 Tax=Trinickia mobilis TaxID=2816356 RepID=UPI001A8D6F65|nr:type II and III secretion system protein family protein [Trinickia mobilis]